MAKCCNLMIGIGVLPPYAVSVSAAVSLPSFLQAIFQWSGSLPLGLEFPVPIVCQKLSHSLAVSLVQYSRLRPLTCQVLPHVTNRRVAVSLSSGSKFSTPEDRLNYTNRFTAKETT